MSDTLLGATVHRVEPITVGKSGAIVERVVTDWGAFIRKRGDVSHQAREADALSALEMCTTLTPRVVGRDSDALVQSELSGVPMSSAIADASPDGKLRLSRLFGRTLRTVHAWKPDFPTGVNDDWAKRLRTFVARHPELAMSLEPTGPAVFSHGDWCLPNALVDGETVTGIVDWGDAGWRDARIDLGTGLWTLHYNLVVLCANPGQTPGKPERLANLSETLASADSNSDSGAFRDAVHAFLDGYGWLEGPEPITPFVQLYCE